MKKVIKVEFSADGRKCAVEQDATGYKWYYVDNMIMPILPGYVTEKMIQLGKVALEMAGA